jgi:hypothetical protein
LTALFRFGSSMSSLSPVMMAQRALMMEMFIVPSKPICLPVPKNVDMSNFEL